MALYAFDGTWANSNASDRQRNTLGDTNVHRICVAYAASGGKAEYKDGVGSRYGIIGKLIGGLTGAGAEKRVEEHFEALQKNFRAGDTDIDVVGYSRGAAISRMFVHRIERDYEFLEVDGKALTEAPTVRFLGLFDTVASFGIPWNADERDFRPDIPEFVQNTLHAMALDETRETFGIERCRGDRKTITEVWFRGSHADIGGDAVYVSKHADVSNRERSDLALNWMLAKARACGLPVSDRVDDSRTRNETHDAPVTVAGDPLPIGNAGTLSRRIHLGDLVHHSVERTELTQGINGQMLRRIDVPTRIEDEELEKSAQALHWVPPANADQGPDNVPIEEAKPSIVELSSRRYPFDVLPARTWRSWLDHWNLDNPGIDDERMLEFWAPKSADRELAWDVYVELMTRIATQELKDDEGNDKSALDSVYALFQLMRSGLHQHGVDCANTGALLVAYLNQKVRWFTAKWHKQSVDEEWTKHPMGQHPEFRAELKELQPVLRGLADALSHLADAKL